MGIFTMLWGRKQISPDELREQISQEIALRLESERNSQSARSEQARKDIASEIAKMRAEISSMSRRLELIESRPLPKSYDDSELRRAIVGLSKKFSDLAVLGRLAIENRERIDSLEKKPVSTGEIAELREEVARTAPIEEVVEDDYDFEPEPPQEPQIPSAQKKFDISEVPRSRMELLSFLLKAENPLSYRQIASKTGLSYNTIKVYVRDLRELGCPFEYFDVKNKRLIAVPNALKTELLYARK